MENPPVPSVDTPLPSDINLDYLSPNVRNLSVSELTPNQQAVRKRTLERYNSQKQLLAEFKQQREMTPPNFPISVFVKYYSKDLGREATSFTNYFLIDNNHDFIFASSFKDATDKVKLQINNPNTTIENIQGIEFTINGVTRHNFDMDLIDTQCQRLSETAIYIPMNLDSNLRSEINSLATDINTIKDEKTTYQIDLWYENKATNDFNNRSTNLGNATSTMTQYQQVIADYEATT
jgi:hypothetical protein